MPCSNNSVGSWARVVTSRKTKRKSSPLAEQAVAAVEEMIYKEENILLPMALDTLTEPEWAEIWRSSASYGWCLVVPRQGYAPPAAVEQGTRDLPKSGGITLPSGNLTAGQLKAIFSTLPMDLTFVDADDRVAFYTEGPERIFPRSWVILGRKVQHCHPARSVETVETILKDFREGRQDVAEFWIHIQEKYVHIRFFAVRDPQQNYLGTLELMQDIAPLRKIAGERRLLEYDRVSGQRFPEDASLLHCSRGSSVMMAI